MRPSRRREGLSAAAAAAAARKKSQETFNSPDFPAAILGEQKLRGSAQGAMAGGTARKWSYRS